MDGGVYDRLAAGVARCRVRVEGDTVAVEVVDANAAFAHVRALLDQLTAAFLHVHATGQAEEVALQVGEARRTATLVPLAPGEVLVTIDDDRFATAFHGNAAAMAFATQKDLRILDVNPRWLEMMGLTREEAIGQTPDDLELISRDAAQARIAQHQRFREGFDTELRIRTRAGERRTVLASARPVEIAEGRCTLTTLIDITARKHAEEAFTAAFDASPAGMILVHSPSDTVLAVNDRMLALVGYTREELVGRSAREIALIRQPVLGTLLAEVEREGRLDAVEVELVRKDGSGVPGLLSTQLVTLQDAPHRLSVFTDIRARKRVERRLLTQHAIGSTLAEARDLDTGLPRMLQALCRGEDWECGAVWLPDATGVLTCRGLWHALPADDPAVRAFEAFTRSVVPGLRDGVLHQVMLDATPTQLVLAAERGALGEAALAAGMTSAIAFPVLGGAHVVGVAAVASRRALGPLDADVLALLDSVGRLLGLFVERSDAEQQLRELNQELERRVWERTQALESSNRDLEAFSSSISHDLRAPLRAISGLSQVMLEDFAEALPAEARGVLERIIASVTRLRTLIDELLAFARLGRGGIKRVEVDLDAMVRSVVDELLAGRALGERLSLRIHRLGTCLADPTLLRAVWVNLVDNALKYTRDRERIEIEIGREVRGAETLYFVRDNGVGFDMSYADKLFGMFQRLHAGNEFEGTGVGLANVRRIVELHHGRVAATSQVGVGSRFEITLGS